jgi:hypothetical protein
VHVFHIFRVFFRAQLEGFFADLKIGAWPTQNGDFEG